jgi:membrane protein DedA with SNARE-associated domain
LLRYRFYRYRFYTRTLRRFGNRQCIIVIIFVTPNKRFNMLLSFRFLYGIRSVTPFAIGMSEVSYLRFTLLNIIGAGIWAIAIASAGYYFG